MANRIPLNEDVLESVDGGNVQYVCTETDRYAWGTHNPDVKYGYTSKRAMLNFIQDNYDYYGESGIFNALIDAGICYNIDSSN